MADPELVETVCTVVRGRLTSAQAEEILRATLPLQVRAKSLILREGDEGAGLLLFLRGRAEVLKQGPDGGQPIAVVEAPSVLGEMSLVTDRRQSATVRALTDCELRLLARRDFHRLLEADSLAAYKLVAAIAEVLAHRLYRMDEKALELAARADRPPLVEELAVFKEKLFSEWSF